jgi:hypothetical protein
MDVILDAPPNLHYNKNANIKLAHVTAMIETTIFPALLSAVSVAETAAAVFKL